MILFIVALISATIINLMTLGNSVKRGSFRHIGYRMDPRFAYAKKNSDPIAYGALLLLHILSLAGGITGIMIALLRPEQLFTETPIQLIIVLCLSTAPLNLFTTVLWLMVRLISKDRALQEEEPIESLSESIVLWIIGLADLIPACYYPMTHYFFR